MGTTAGIVVDQQKPGLYHVVGSGAKQAASVPSKITNL